MAGILDPKSRIMDVIITQAGKRQIAEGELFIKYASFTDGDTFYAGEEHNVTKTKVARSAEHRPFFEACNLPSDQICQDVDADVSLLPFEGPGFRTFGGESYIKSQGILTASEGGMFDTPVFNIYQRATGSQMELIASGVFSTSARHFSQLNIIGTSDYFTEDDTLELSTKNLVFDITTDRPVYTGGDVQADLNADGFGDQLVHPTIGDLDPVWSDPCFAHLKDFSYLPPQTQFLDGTVNTLGVFTKMNGTPFANLNSFLTMASGKERHTISFLQTSMANNIFCQMYEKDTSTSTLDKLIFVDMGTYPNQADWSPSSRIVFAGKFYRSETNDLCFAKVFTLVFE